MELVSHEHPRSTFGVESVLGGLRRLRLLGDSAPDGESVFVALARELIDGIGAEEVHVHHLLDVPDSDLVVVHMLGGDSRLSYLEPHEERPPGIAWVASTGRSFLAVGSRELEASLPRVAAGCVDGEGRRPCALLVPLTISGQVESVVVLVRCEAEPFGERSMEQASLLVDQAAGSLALARARLEAGTDPVAGCMNHRAMRRRLSEEIARARRSGTSLSCLMIDLDDFKLVNDRHGHQVGDALLREVAHALMGEFRAFDRVARYGGDEFVVILPQADIDSAAAAAARALGRMKAVVVPAGAAGASSGASRGVSASLGVAQWREPMDADALLAACDAALLERKRAGKAGVTRALGSPTMAVDG
jgi:diguanylate cyclase (GGDEF)-like protein